MQEKYQVFISSPFMLQNQRKAAIEAVVDAGHIPVALERFAAQNSTDKKVIEQAVSECQIMICVLGHRAGSLLDPTTAPAAAKSFSQFEFELAEHYNVATLVFFQNEDQARAELARDYPGGADPESHARELGAIENFRRKVANHFAPPWESEWSYDKFVYEFSKSLQKLLDRGVPRSGWIAALPDKKDREVQLAVSNEFIRDTVTALNSFKRLDERCREAPEQKHAMAKFFCEEFVDPIIRKRCDIFFESGSTPAFVAKALAANERLVHEFNRSGQSAYTNNVLVFLHYWLSDKIPVRLLPRSTPTDPYGACFGDMKVMEPLPYYDQRALPRDAHAAIDALQGTIRETITGPALMVAAASGIQLNTSPRFEYPAGFEKLPAAEREIQDLAGIHVGDYKNMLFKGALYLADVPTVIVGTGAKLNAPITPGKCYFVFGSRGDWETFLKEKPIAFCIGCDQEEIQVVEKAFGEISFEVKTSSHGAQMALLARNKGFSSIFPKTELREAGCDAEVEEAVRDRGYHKTKILAEWNQKR